MSAKVLEISGGDDTRRAVPPMIERSSTPGSGPVKTLGLPAKFSATPGEVRSGAPVYGQHTREVLRDHGFADAEIGGLLVEGAIAIAHV